MADFECHECGRKFKSEQAVDSHSEALQHYPYWDCNMCDDTFDNPVDLTKHKTEEHKHLCVICNNTFNYAPALERHRKKCHNHHCQKCQRSFVDKQALDQHLNNAPIHQVSCPRCKITINEAQYQAHCDAEHQHNCEQCTASFPTASKLQHHIQSEHVKACQYCSLIVTTGEALIAHQNVTHNFKCDYCVLKFHDCEARQRHSDLEHPFCCPRCTLSFKSKTALSDHVKERHPLMCFQCNKAFINKEAVETHLKTFGSCRWREQAAASQILGSSTTPEKPQCPECNFSFGDFAGLINHYKWAHAGTAIHCPKCFKTCANRAELLEHNISMHMAKCDKCDALFKDVAGLLCHARVHAEVTTGTGLSSASQCTPNANITEVATKTTKYKCIPCNDTFSTDEELKRHQNHSPFHQKRDMECIECNIKFETQIELLQHLDASPHETRWILILV